MAGPEVLFRTDVGDGGLAEPGRAVQEDVVERLVPPERGPDEDAQIGLHLFLADVLVERPGAQGEIGAAIVHLRRRIEQSVVSAGARVGRRSDRPALPLRARTLLFLLQGRVLLGG